MITSIVISLANVGCVIWGIESGDVGAIEYVSLFFAVTLAFIAGTEK